MTEGGVTNKDVAVKLGLKKSPDLRMEEYYPTYLSMAKNFMEGQEGEREKGGRCCDLRHACGGICDCFFLSACVCVLLILFFIF